MATGRNRFRDLLGTPPIHPVLFALAKLALALVLLLPIAQVAGVPFARSVRGSNPVSVTLVAVALALFLFAGTSLGRSVRMGLPTDATELKTAGIYRFGRHPMYLAMFLLAAAASLYCPHPAVLVSAALVIVLHHRIALAEEAFLERRFGQAWLAHKAKVPRYVGLPPGGRR